MLISDSNILIFFNSFFLQESDNRCGDTHWRAANNGGRKSAKLDETGLEIAGQMGIHVILITIRAITNNLSCQVNGKSGKQICQLLMMCLFLQWIFSLFFYESNWRSWL